MLIFVAIGKKTIQLMLPIGQARVQLFRNTSFNTSIEPVYGNEVRKIFKSLKHSTAPGYDAVANGMIKQLSCHSATN